MKTENNKDKTSRIDLAVGNKTRKQLLTVEASNNVPVSSAETAISLDELRRNYDIIIKTGAIHYPVAYQFLRELGRGRQGTVFLSHRQGARGCITRNAIKVFDPGIYHNAAEYWTDMGRIASQISKLHEVHGPHLVSRHSYEEAYGIGYVEMDAIDGMDIQRLLSKDHIKIARQNCTSSEMERFSETIFNTDEGTVSFRPGLVVYIMRRILRGLERLHSVNFLHCDIKPANVMIDRLGSVQIVDFGRAVIQQERLSFLLGAPLYLAPETHRREAIDVRSDLYSVGLIGLEMLMGTQPIDIGTMDEKKLLAAKEEIAGDPAAVLPEKSRKNRKLIKIIKRLIAPIPADRYESAREVEEGSDSLKLVDNEFVQSTPLIEYERELSDYLAKLVDRKTERIEIGVSEGDGSAT